MKLALTLALAAAACSDGKSKDQCRAEATAVGDLLVAAAQEPAAMLVLRDEVRLVTRTDLPRRKDVSRAPVVMLAPAAMTVDDKPIADVAALTDQLTLSRAMLEEELQRYPQAEGRERRRVYFMIDPAMPWERVVAAVDAASKAGFTAPAFVFEQPPGLQPPPRSPIDDKLDAIMKADPSERATQVAQLASKLVDKCRPLADEFGRVTGDPAENKAMTIASAVKPALIACNCSVNIPELRSVMFRVIFVPRPLRVVMFDADGSRLPIELPRNATWAEASKRFTPTLKNAELIAR